MIKRNKLLDYIRGITVFLMVFGHCIQIGSGSQYIDKQCFFDDFLYKFIYSFHMPMFMIISGYLYNNTLKKVAIKDGIKKNIKKYLVIIASVWIVKCLFGLERINVSITDILKSIYSILWFIWNLFFATSLVLLIEKITKKFEIEIYLLLFISFFFTPDNARFSVYKYMFPYFLIGIYLNKIGAKRNKILKSKLLLCIAIVFYIILLLLFNRETFIYLSGVTLLWKRHPILQIVIDFHRYFIGIFGCYIFYRVCNWLLSCNIFDDFFIVLGRNSLYIYIFTTEFFNEIIKMITIKMKPNYFINLLETIISLVMSLLITRIIELMKGSLLNIKLTRTIK